MDIRGTYSEYKYYHRCEHCGSALTIYPSDCIYVPHDVIPSTNDRRMHLACPVCCNHMIIYYNDMPNLFKTVLAKKLN